MERFHIVLVEPQIPQNTGNIGRLCVATDSVLHLIHPLGFSTEQKQLRRAGLDYWQHLEVYEWADLDAFWRIHPLSHRHFFFSTKACKYHYDAPLSQGGYLYFGREDRGLDSELVASRQDFTYKLPMCEGIRSINLATSVGAALYEGLRQLGSYKQWGR